MKKRYIVYVIRGENDQIEQVSIPMKYAYVFIAAALMGMFTIAGMAGSYGRMLAKAESVNRLRDELALSRKDYAHLEKQSHEKDVQVASLGSLASEVSALYGLTAGKLTLPHGLHPGKSAAAVAAAKAPVKDDSASFTDDSYYKSLDTFYALKSTATTGISAPSSVLNPNLGVRGSLSGFAGLDLGESASAMPDMWPVMGPINSGFGEREDPVLGGGTGEFHKGVDIGAPDGSPVYAPAAGRVVHADWSNGYGREVAIEHGNGITTIYGHLKGFNVRDGQQVVKGQVIGFVGHSGRTTGTHLHYEVQVRGTAVNPHKYLRTTMAQLGGATGTGGL